MPHRIRWLSRAHYQDPLVDYGSTEFVLQFQDAAQLLQQWRNPHLGRSSREGALIGIAANARMAAENITQMLMTTDLSEDQEKDLMERRKIYLFMLEHTLPMALELVNEDKLLTPEDIMKFIQQQLKYMREELGTVYEQAYSIMNKLEEITDIEVTDQFGRKRRIQRSDVLDIIGRALGSLLMRQASFRPVDDIDARPRGRILARETYRAAMIRTGMVPPPNILEQDIRVLNKDRLSLVYFIVDVSQSMGKVVFTGGLTRLDGALLTSLGLFYFYNLTNRRKRREFDSFQMHLVPVVELPYVIEDKKKLEDFLFKAEAKGKTRLVHALNAVVRHVKEHHKNNDYDVQIVMLTDGRPNVPFEGKLPGSDDPRLREYFRKESENTNMDSIECMIQLNRYFNYLRLSRDRIWNVSYFLMAREKFRDSSLFRDTQEMLKGITRPILIDPTDVDKLGAKIIQETMR